MYRLSERDFLIEYAVRKYNHQYGTRFTRADFDLRSIQPRAGFDLGYEYTSLRTDDYVRMRIYFKFSNLDSVNDFRLELDYPDYRSSLGDEVSVAYGTIDKYHLESGRYKFRWIGLDIEKQPVLITTDGVPLVTETGLYFQYIPAEPSDLEDIYASSQSRS